MSGVKFEEAMSCKDTRKHFKKYLQNAYCGEMLDFWIALNKYNKKMNKSASYDKMYALAYEIYNKFLTPQTKRKSQPRKTKHNKRFANISENCINSINKQLRNPDAVILDELYSTALSEVAEQLQTRWTSYLSISSNKNISSNYSSLAHFAALTRLT